MAKKKKCNKCSYLWDTGETSCPLCGSGDWYWY